MNRDEELKLLRAQAITRRQFFGGLGLGLGSIALNSLLASEAAASSKLPSPFRGGAGGGVPAGPMAPKRPMLPAKAKSVIYLHMAGSPSQLELFEYKPELAKYDGQDCPEAFLKGKRFAFI